jgi:short-subunit dehydrogenase
LTDPLQIERLAHQVLNRFGRVDALINNAGYGCFGGFLEIPLDEYRGMMETNYLSAIRLTHALLPAMLRQGGGTVLNIASVAGLMGIPNLAAYCASKFALIGFSEALRLEFAPLIRVGVLCPGPVQTPFFGDETPARFFPKPILKRLIDTDTVARHAVRLLDRPKTKIIPATLRWAIRFNRLAPGLSFRITKKWYAPLLAKEQDMSGKFSV